MKQQGYADSRGIPGFCDFDRSTQYKFRTGMKTSGTTISIQRRCSWTFDASSCGAFPQTHGEKRLRLGSLGYVAQSVVAIARKA
jgi:hypothetical protein